MAGLTAHVLVELDDGLPEFNRLCGLISHCVTQAVQDEQPRIRDSEEASFGHNLVEGIRADGDVRILDLQPKQMLRAVAPPGASQWWRDGC